MDCEHTGTELCYQCKNRDKFHTTAEIQALSYKEKCERHEKRAKRDTDETIDLIAREIYDIGLAHEVDKKGSIDNRREDDWRPLANRLKALFRSR